MKLHTVVMQQLFQNKVRNNLDVLNNIKALNRLLNDVEILFHYLEELFHDCLVCDGVIFPLHKVVLIKKPNRYFVSVMGSQ
jgi:hypothetical protein